MGLKPMAKVETDRVEHTDLHEHPAVRALNELQSRSVVPVRIEILKGKGPKRKKRLKHTMVCRLVGLGPSGGAVIGKRCRRANALIENTIYEEVLPSLPVTTPEYYGMQEEAHGEFCWLFLEDAGEQGVSTLDGEHREIIIRWLCQMHTSASQVVAPTSLPGKGPSQYLEHLRLTRHAILENLANLPPQAEDLPPLETILSQFDLLESRWDQVTEFCGETPQTLVHGDFVAKNIRIRSSQNGIAPIPFDWGEAGWGTPAVDVMQVDVTSYWSFVRGHWSWMDVYAIKRLAVAGRIFRCLDAIYCELPKTAWLKIPRNSMGIYASWLDDVIRAAGL